ncbi:MAG TPA: PAC2 family protein [Candidatus Thermoplasmatota archaeon]
MTRGAPANVYRATAPSWRGPPGGTPLTTFTRGQITIEETEPLDLSSAMLLECFPTIGLVSTIAASYLVTQLQLSPKGSVAAPWSAPLSVVLGGRPLPPIRLYGGEKVCGIDGNCDQLFVLMSEFPIPDFGIQPLSAAILDWAGERGCREVASLEGLPRAGEGEGGDEEEEAHAHAQVPSGAAKVYGVGTTDRARNMLRREGVEEMSSGVITGISGVLMWMAEQRRVDAVCLLAEAFRQFPDARAAAGLVRIVDGMLKNIEVEIEPLMDQAEQLEKQIKKAVDAAVAAQQARQPPPHTSYASPSMYG